MPTPPGGSHGPLLLPFAGLRYEESVAGPLGSLVAPPHTELGPSLRSARLASSPYTVTHLERPEYSPGDGPAVRRWLAEGALVEDEPGYYVVRQRREDGREHRFLLAALLVGPETDGRVHPHESTIPEAVVSRVERLRATGVDSEPVLLVDDAGGHTARLVASAEELGAHVATGRTTAAAPLSLDVWHLRDPAVVESITVDMSRHDLLIADGHHRFAAVREMARASGATQRLLVAVGDQRSWPLDLVSLHRVAPIGAWDALLAAACEVEEVDAEPAAVLTVLRGLSDPWVVLAGADRALCLRTDPTLAAGAGAGAWVDTVLAGSGLEDRTVRYEPDAGAALHRRPADSLGVLIPRPTLAGVRAVVDRGGHMGRKTTSFRPKPLAGTVLRLR
ncbi:DUF1015 family protein [Kineococcus sp. R8]|uniref:DUF1015 family protein n=1 Tax=Kineococcus siccus TaxID=2696567 RepID=UPI0014137878|nr:DUF1015 family protein [Kineococcus siccus]